MLTRIIVLLITVFHCACITAAEPAGKSAETSLKWHVWLDASPRDQGAHEGTPLECKLRLYHAADCTGKPLLERDVRAADADVAKNIINGISKCFKLEANPRDQAKDHAGTDSASVIITVRLRTKRRTIAVRFDDRQSPELKAEDVVNSLIGLANQYLKDDNTGLSIPGRK